jgi:putative ABC transport system permease protein
VWKSPRSSRSSAASRACAWSREARKRAGTRVAVCQDGCRLGGLQVNVATAVKGVTGRHATMVDLEYADRLTADASHAREPQVWLNAAAPPDVLDRLAAQGLTVKDDIRSGQIHRQLDRQRAALALWFYVLAGGLSVLLGAGALVLATAVDGARRIEDIRTLRVQGLRRPPMSRATLWTYPVPVLIAALVAC